MLGDHTRIPVRDFRLYLWSAFPQDCQERERRVQRHVVIFEDTLQDSGCVTDRQKSASREMLPKSESGLFGFVEPPLSEDAPRRHKLRMDSSAPANYSSFQTTVFSRAATHNQRLISRNFLIVAAQSRSICRVHLDRRTNPDISSCWKFEACCIIPPSIPRSVASHR